MTSGLSSHNSAKGTNVGMGVDVHKEWSVYDLFCGDGM